MELFLADADEALVLQVFYRFCVFGYETYIEDHADVDGRCCEVVSAAVVRESVLVGVASRVIALPARAADTCARGEHDEEVKTLGRTKMEIPAPLYFRADDGCEIVASHILKGGILKVSQLGILISVVRVRIGAHLEDHSTLKNASNRRHGSSAFVEYSLQLFPVTYITSVNRHSDILRLQLFDQFSSVAFLDTRA